MTVKKAVIPAAGLGTRFLPATKSVPKEMIPVIDKPAIQYVVEEIVDAGIEDILIVTSRGKVVLEDHFDRSPELERHLEQTGKTEALESVRAAAELANVHYVRQKEPLGFGHAVLLAKQHVGDEPFVVGLPDELVPLKTDRASSLLTQMLRVHEARDASVIAVQGVPKEEVSAYGIITPEPVDESLVRILEMVEKPPVEEARSDLAARGRYVFTPEIFETIEKTSAGVGGEVQLTDAINLLAKESEVYALVYEGPILDVGRKLDFLRATVRLALERDDVGPALRSFLNDLLRSEGLD
jgi:UTP--glucose-1-phosphate uridylyltransferase